MFLVAQLCLTLWDLLDYSPPGFSVHGIIQARTLEWVAIFPPPVHPPHPEIEPMFPLSPALQAVSLPTEPLGKPFNNPC